MITSARAEFITNQYASIDPFYASICDTRKNHRCHRYTINDYLYFEYWTPDEWEFTIDIRYDNPRRMEYINLATAMTKYMKSIRVTYSRIPSLMALCTAKASEIK